MLQRDIQTVSTPDLKVRLGYLYEHAYKCTREHIQESVYNVFVGLGLFL